MPNLETGMLLIALALALSILTYIFIERRIRFGENKALKAVIASVLLTVVGAMGLSIYLFSGVPDRKK